MNAASRGCAGVVSLLILTGMLAGFALAAKSQTFDLSRDFSRLSNPAGAWSYGYETNVGGGFTRFTDSWQSLDNGGALIDIWTKSDHDNAAIYHNGSSTTGSCCYGQGVYPPGAIWLVAGAAGHVDNYCAIRLTIPPGGAGTYRLESPVHTYIDGSISGDTDLHVVLNGTELFGQFISPSSGGGYTNSSLALSDGDTVDFLVGRGADNIQYGSGLKIQATLDLTDTNPVAPTILTKPQSQTVTAGTSVTFRVAANGTTPLSYQWQFNGNDLSGANVASLTLNNVQSSDAGNYSVTVSNAVGVATSADATLTVNPPPVQSTYDLVRDFSRFSNPAGAWSYGYETNIGGRFTRFTDSWQSVDNGGALIDIWTKSDHDNAAIYHNGSSITGSCCYGQGTYPPGTIWMVAGVDGHVDNYCAVRLTIPPGGAGTYRLESAVHTFIDGSISGDTDLHFVLNGTELFGQFISPSSGGGYTNSSLALNDGDKVDFLVGRGADNIQYGSGLKIQATVDLIDTNPAAPTILTQPQSQTVSVGANVRFTVLADGTAPLTYQWLLNGNIIDGAANPTLTLNDVQFSDAANYSVVISNSIGRASSTDAVLVVNPPPPPPKDYDLVRDFSRFSNPAGAWSYGYETSIGGGFARFTDSWQSVDNGGALIDIWTKSDHDNAAIYHNGSSITGACCYGQGSYPPGTIWMVAGIAGHVDNYCAVRLTIPPGGAGTYRLGSAVHTYIDGSISGDTDLHVVLNGTELFGQFISPSSGGGYTNSSLALNDGDTVDFLVGRGADNIQYGSGLKLQATLDLTDTNPAAPAILTQPQSQTVYVGANVTFTVLADGTAPLAYQWLLNGNIIDGATNPRLALSDVQFSDAASYSVVISNLIGSVNSTDAVLVVNPPPPPPPPPKDYDLSRDFSIASNPSGSWSYGYETNIGGGFTLFHFSRQLVDASGALIDTWAKNN